MSPRKRKDWMPTRAPNPELAAALRSLAEVQLQIQASRSATLDAGAIGVIGVDAAVTTFIVGGALGDQPIAALVMLGLSAGVAGRSVFLGGPDEIGPSVKSLIASDETDDSLVLEESLLNSLASDVDANHQALARKPPGLTAALVFLALAIMIAVVAGVH